ncbi:response regulator transcription factor [Paenibacillus donghaensis]|uniref:DNA-binding response regulator n=1 Tax=Paenibacillus donghaensis TaxID=414771 RepID=A0A2Z2KXA2_9BACL|nr:response regulator transcription factor [Paenibacillus donghaensis]ASA24868.1 DNA-binding response regulator [Paenibacillus donghaensis]
MKNQILYIDDDIEVGDLVTRDLENRGYVLTWLTSPDDYLEHMNRTDLVILDIMMPGLDGFTIGQRMKTANPDIPILFLTARTALEDKLKGLKYAEDYVTKPFHPDELAARIEVLLRRFDKVGKEVILLKHLEIDMKVKRILNTDTNTEIILTEKQHKIFLHFLKHPNQILTKEQIYEYIWDQVYIEGDKTLMVHIRYLRQRIEKDPQNPEIIETIRGIGYRVMQ